MSVIGIERTHRIDFTAVTFTQLITVSASQIFDIVCSLRMFGPPGISETLSSAMKMVCGQLYVIVLNTDGGGFLVNLSVV